MERTISYVLLIGTMILWAANFHVVKIALNYYPPLGVAAYRFLFAVITLFIIMGFNRKKYLKHFKKLCKKDWLYMFLVALFGIFLTIYFFNVGLKTTSAINGSLIIATTPAITGLLSTLVLKKQLKVKQWLAIAISFFGVVLILVKGDFSRLLELQFVIGDIYILCMATVFSFSQILVNKYLTQVNSILMTFISSFLALAMFALFSVPEFANNPLPRAMDFWWSILFMGVLGSGLAYTAFYYAVVKLGANLSTLSMNLIPFFTVLLAFPFGEKIYPVQIIGGLIVVTGMVLFIWKKYTK